MENENDQQEVLNPDENTELEKESEGESVDALKEKLSKAEELAHNQKIRAEKAESLAKQLKKEPEEKETPKNYSLQDIKALSDVHDEDVEELVSYAKFKNISVSEAKKYPIMKATLAEKAELRKTAEATNTGGGRNVVNKISPEKLVSDLSEGKSPEKGSREAEELFWARRGGKKE